MDLTEHTAMVWSLAISKEGQLISVSHDQSIKVWNIETGKILKTLNGHTYWVFSLAITKEGKLISGSNDKKIKVWDIDSGKTLKT